MPADAGFITIRPAERGEGIPLSRPSDPDDDVPPRVLLADDDVILLEVLAEILTEAGCTVTPVPNGRAAIERLGVEAFDVVLTDIQMPDATGVDVLRAVREHDLDAHVILMTGNPTVPTAVEALRLGAVGYLTKPVPTASLVEAVAEATRLARLGRLRRQALAELGGDAHLNADRAGLESMFARVRAGLYMAYQPIVWARDGSLFGHEALVRTTALDGQGAAGILRIAERLERMPVLGRQIRETVAADLATLEGAVLVNVHPVEFYARAFAQQPDPLASFSGRIVLEITEHASVEEIRETRETIAQLRSRGHRIAIDDLGAGYSALSSFASLEPDIVKIDMSLVRAVDTHPTKRRVVGSIVDLCRDLGILVIAEGIETEAERAAICESGCDLLQGYLIGRPTPLSRG